MPPAMPVVCHAGSPVIMRGMKPLTAQGVLLRPFEGRDIDMFVEAVRESGNSVGAWMPWWKSNYSEEDARAWFAPLADLLTLPLCRSFYTGDTLRNEI